MRFPHMIGGKNEKILYKKREINKLHIDKSEKIGNNSSLNRK